MRILLMMLVFAFMHAGVALAVPNLIDFQGSLIDGAENPISGEKQITFRFEKPGSETYYFS
jgi:hypothetical protein